MDQRSRRQCTDSDRTGNKTSVRCHTGLCYARYNQSESSDENVSKVQKCQTGHSPVLLSELEFYVSPESSHEKELLEYRCNKNVCNRNGMIEIIKGLVHEYTHWNLTKVDLNQAQTKQASSSTRLSNLSAAFLVLIYIFVQLLF